ncbi:MAG: FAD-dependent thymidylate synthase [Clostridiaceae bacterium]|nr:FAD-dependent thymidylate synthase [Clostridiaceae bacterium]
MRLIKPSFEIWEQEPGLEGVYKQIERAGRVCYKSEDKIAEGTAKAFVDRMIASGHGAMLEHGTIYLAIPMTTGHSGMSELRYMDNEYSIVTESTGLSMKDELGNKCDCWCVTTNLRVLIENDWLEDTWYLCEPTEYHAKRTTVKFICDRGVSHEYVRHRVFSFAQESTRYCNYSKDKFGNELTCIIPNWLDLKDGSYSIKDVEEPYDRCLIIDRCTNEEGAAFVRALCYAEKEYFHLIQLGWKPQQARAVLPNSLKTELVMTGTIKQWEGFFKLRDAGSAHPQAYELAHPLHEEFIKRGYVTV